MKDITTEEAVQTLKDFAMYGRYYSNNTEHHMKSSINRVLNELEKKDEIINAMAKEISDYTKSCPLKIFGKGMDCDTRCDTNIKKDCWKLYFEQEVKDE